MSRLNERLIDKIAQTCIELYDKLPKSGKPIEKEWTVLSCVVQYHENNEDIKVVSLGTGSKCVGASKMSSSGDILNDSHAEVFARRSFLLYIFDNIVKALEQNESIFMLENNKFKLRKYINFIFYASQLPCGDASIIPKTGEEEHFGDILISNKRDTETHMSNVDAKSPRLHVNDIHRTGAKCLPLTEQDPKQPGIQYHLLGKVRTKPGRGDRTLSVSCSDKMARWIHVGIQGALLDMFLCEPIYIKHIIFGAGVPFSEESLNRALLNRNFNNSMIILKTPQFYQSSIIFPHVRSEDRVRPAPGSIVWSRSNNELLEVAVQGRKLGVTKKKRKMIALSSSLCISKYNLYRRFHEILYKNEGIKQNLFGHEETKNIPYNEMKRKSEKYQKNWSLVKQEFFKIWTKKLDIWNFCVDNT